MIPVLGIFIGVALYHTFSTMTYLELAILTRLLTVGVVLYLTYLYFEAILGEMDEECKGNACISVIMSDGLEEVKEMIGTPAPSPSKEESTEFADLLSADEKNNKKD